MILVLFNITGMFHYCNYWKTEVVSTVNKFGYFYLKKKLSLLYYKYNLTPVAIQNWASGNLIGLSAYES